MVFHDIVPGPFENVSAVPKFGNEVKDWNQGGYGIGWFSKFYSYAQYYPILGWPGGNSIPSTFFSYIFFILITVSVIPMEMGIYLLLSFSTCILHLTLVTYFI